MIGKAWRRLARRKADGERGAALVEFAMLTPLFLLLLFGIIEFGLAFRTQLTVSNAVQQAGRVAATLGNDLDMDYETLASMQQGLNNLPGGTIKWVHIYNADTSGNPMSACSPGGTSNCNVYQYQKDYITSPQCDWNPCPAEANSYDYGGGWLPGDRNVALDPNPPGLDDVGVRIYYAHNWLTGGLIPVADASCTSSTLNDCWMMEAVFRLEPKVGSLP